MRRLNKVVRFLLVIGLLVGIAWAAAAVTEVKRINVNTANFGGTFMLEDMQMCPDGKTAWIVGVGPGSADNGWLFKYDLATDAVAKDSAGQFIRYPLGTFYGPRGTPGLAIDIACSKAYVPNYPLNTVAVVDLATGTTVAEIPVQPSPTDATLTLFDNKYLIVTSTLTDTVNVIDTAENSVVCAAQTGAVAGPNQVTVIGHQVAYVVNRYTDTVSVLDLTQLPNCVMYPDPDTPITGLDRVPTGVAITPDGAKMYAVDFSADKVDVIDTASKSVIKSISICDGPQYIVVSLNGKFVYASCSFDKKIAVIDTASNALKETFNVVAENEPAPIGMIAVTDNNRYLYVYWAGGIRGTPSAFQLIKFDLVQLY